MAYSLILIIFAGTLPLMTFPFRASLVGERGRVR